MIMIRECRPLGLNKTLLIAKMNTCAGGGVKGDEDEDNGGALY